MRQMITDAMWAIMEPLVKAAKKHKCGHPPEISDRKFFEGLLYIGRTGIPLRDLPSEFGAWDALYNRFRRWLASGSMKRLFESLTADPAFDSVRRVLVDSTTMRAHRHAAGARRKKRRSGRSGRPVSKGSAAAAAV